MFVNESERVVTKTWECLRKKWLENKMAGDVTEPTDCLMKT